MKPSIYKNEALALLGPDAFRLFTGLWCLADRQGRLYDEPGKIEAQLFPYKFQRVKIEYLMDALAGGEDPFIIRYEVKGKKCVQISKFLAHQRPHPRELQSTIPPSKEKFIPRTYLGATQDAPETPLPSLSSSSSFPSLPSCLKTTPSAPKQNGAAKPFWKEMIQHLNDAWSKRKKGAKYVWSGKDFSALKRVLAVYTPFEVMALWDIYLNSDDEFARRQGYNVTEFVRQFPRLVDGNWKQGAEHYLGLLMPENKAGMAQVKSLVTSLGHEIPK